MALRWGIASAGRISHDFVVAVSTLPENDHQVVAVAARSLTRAQEFAKLHNIQSSYEGYIQLAKDPQVDVVYIGVLNPQHIEVAMLMLQHNKHVLCEKPLTMNIKESRQLVELARKKKLFLMEAVWSRCFPAYKELRKQLQNGVIGEVKQVLVGFGFPLTTVERLSAKDLGGGTILDLGIYTLQFQQFIFGSVKPLKVVAAGHLNENGIDECMSAVLTYPGGKIASIQTNATVKMPNEAIVVGTNGTIRIPEFWCPTKLILPNETLEYELPKAKLPFKHLNSAGLSYEAEEVRQCIKKGLTENPSITLDESLQLTELMDTIRSQVGVVFAQDLH